MNSHQAFNDFKNLHQPGKPVILYNCWDAGSALKLQEAGAKAVATGSKPLALSQGYEDGENIPFTRLCETAQQITNHVQVPVSIDFEGGYAGENDEVLAQNTAELLRVGVVGVNFEDKRHPVGVVFDQDVQVRRIGVLRQVSEQLELPLFVNARTDLFLLQKENHGSLVEQAIERGKAFKEAGADGFFVPGLIDLGLIQRVCDSVDLPVNIIKLPTAPDNKQLAAAGAARISYGPFAYADVMSVYMESAKQALSSL
jgi:2-methylisocitrate lyase-like PEP mutase family enzyme